MSPGFMHDTSLDLVCLRSRASERVSHDHFFHSVLGLMGVRTSVHDRARDAYAPCRNGAAAFRAGAGHDS